MELLERYYNYRYSGRADAPAFSELSERVKVELLATRGYMLWRDHQDITRYKTFVMCDIEDKLDAAGYENKVAEVCAALGCDRQTLHEFWVLFCDGFYVESMRNMVAEPPTLTFLDALVAFHSNGDGPDEIREIFQKDIARQKELAASDGAQ